MKNTTFLNKLENINEQLNLAHYWIIILKYKRILFIVPVLLTMLGFFITLQINPIFKSSATLVIEESTKNIVNISEVYEAGTTSRFGNSNYINNQIQILESDEVLSSILLDEKNLVKIKSLYKKLPKQFLAKNFNFFKKINKENEKDKQANTSANRLNIKSYIKKYKLQKKIFLLGLRKNPEPTC